MISVVFLRWVVLSTIAVGRQGKLLMLTLRALPPVRFVVYTIQRHTTLLTDIIKQQIAYTSTYTVSVLYFSRKAMCKGSRIIDRHVSSVCVDVAAQTIWLMTSLASRADRSVVGARLWWLLAGATGAGAGCGSQLCVCVCICVWMSDASHT